MGEAVGRCRQAARSRAARHSVRVTGSVCRNGTCRSPCTTHDECPRYDVALPFCVDMVCANLSFEGGAGNPVVRALPELLCVPLEELPETGLVLSLLFVPVVVTLAFDRRT